MIEWASEAAGLKIKTHAHMLRHACGFKLANDGVDTRALQAYLGPQEYPEHTVRYTELGQRASRASGGTDARTAAFPGALAFREDARRLRSA
jgi:integrase